ncbi:glycine--tRNA ligase subunit beta [Pseudomonas aeruginosa]
MPKPSPTASAKPSSAVVSRRPAAAGPLCRCAFLCGAAPSRRAGRATSPCSALDRTVNLDGPPLQAAFDVASGNPTQAALPSPRSAAWICSRSTRAVRKLRFSQTIAGQTGRRPAAGHRRGLVERTADSQGMRWAPRREEFVRPTQWLVMLFGDDVE